MRVMPPLSPQAGATCMTGQTTRPGWQITHCTALFMGSHVQSGCMRSKPLTVQHGDLQSLSHYHAALAFVRPFSISWISGSRVPVPHSASLIPTMTAPSLTGSARMLN